MYIAIAGNIGAGKTTLTKMLAKYYGWEPRFESVSFNPYLEDYYSDIQRWAFCLETYFLKERVFVRNNYERGDLSQRDFETFMELFDLMKSQMKMPDMMIYLRKSVPALIAQIQKRGREYEQAMQIDYLKDLNDKYEDFIFRKYDGRVLVIDSDGMDFENNPADFRAVVDKVDAELFGLFSENNWSKQ